MSRRTVTGALSVALLAGVALAAVSVASGASTQPHQSAVKWEPLASAGAVTSGRYEYHGVRGQLPAGRQGYRVFSCPAGHPHAISGWFVSNSILLVNSASAPDGPRRWVEAVTNLSRSTHTVDVGVVCAR